MIYDANGNEYTGVHCTRCGMHIKHVFTWNGQPYGSDCIEVVTGVKFAHMVFKKGELDLEATRKAEADKEAEIVEAEKKHKARKVSQASNRALNRIKYAGLLNVLFAASNREGDFAHSMAMLIADNGFSTKLTDALTFNQWDIVRQIYAKHFGRRGSKKYNAAFAEFEERYDYVD